MMLVRFVLLTALLLPLSTARADAPCADGVRDDGTFVVCGEPERPSAVYVLPRARRSHPDRELRRTYDTEIVRDGERL